MGLYQYDSTEDKLNLVAGSTNFSDAPVGAIFPFGGTDIPISFLLCDGSAVSRTDYEDLFNVIGTAFGTGDGSTTFNLPDLREAVPKGAGLTGKTVGAHLDADGLAVGEFIDDRIKAHSHRIMTYTGSQTSISNVYGNTGVASNIDASDSMSYVTNVTRNGSKGPIIESTGSATTEVKSVGVNYIIKAKQVGMPTDFASAVGDIVVDKNTYSTSETIVGKWIDGKPIYRVVRHVWDVGNVPATGYSFSGTTLSGPLTNNAESIIKVVILCKNNQGSWQELTGNGEGGPTQNFVWISDTSAYFINGGVLAGAWAIFEYTKTTD